MPIAAIGAWDAPFQRRVRARRLRTAGTPDSRPTVDARRSPRVRPREPSAWQVQPEGRSGATPSDGLFQLRALPSWGAVFGGALGGGGFAWRGRPCGLARGAPSRTGQGRGDEA